MPSLSERASIIGGKSMTRSKKVFGKWGGRGYGAYVTDVDGVNYLDMMCALGARSLNNDDMFGYDYGVNFGVYSLPQIEEIEASEAVLKHAAPWASSVRFTKTGSEACHAAYRIAKAATGRRCVLFSESAYHGWHEWCDKASIDALTFDEGQDLSLKYFARYPESIAAVFVEPPRFQPVEVAWLQHVREFCTRIGALMIMDEMIWGGRFALGGCTEYHSVIPDLACWGKAFGNGQSVAFITGSEALAKHGEIVSGTYSGDTLGLRAVCDTLQAYTTEPVIDTLWERARQLHAGWTHAVPASFATLTGPAPLMGIQYTHPEQERAFINGLMKQGVLCCGKWFMTMYAHTPEHMDRVVEAAAAVAKELA